MRSETRSASRRPNVLHVILTVVAMTGLLLFILACRPSWSPDGRKVAYAYWDKGSKQTLIAVFDRKTRSSRLLFQWWDKTSSSDESFTSPQWTKDGQRILVTTYESEGTQIIALPVNAKSPTQVYTLDKLVEPIMSYPELHNTLFAVEEKGLIRLNLDTGEFLRKQIDGDGGCVLYDGGETVLYMRGLPESEKAPAETKGSAENSRKSDDEGTGDYEFGELDQKDLSLHPRLTVKSADLRTRKLVYFSGMLDVDPRNRKFAVPEDNDGTKTPKIIVIGNAGIEQVLDPGIKGEAYALGNPQWSRDGQSIFIAAQIEHQKSNKVVLLELSLDNKHNRIDSLVEGPDDQVEMGLIALSPDGKWIAMTAAGDNVRQRGLYLIDVSRESRPVSFYPAPSVPRAPGKD